MSLGKYVEALETLCMAGEFKCYSGLGETVQFLKRLNGMAMDLAGFLVLYSAVSACSQKHTLVSIAELVIITKNWK